MWDKVYRKVAGGKKMDINSSILVHSVHLVQALFYIKH